MKLTSEVAADSSIVVETTLGNIDWTGGTTMSHSIVFYVFADESLTVLSWIEPASLEEHPFIRLSTFVTTVSDLTRVTRPLNRMREESNLRSSCATVLIHQKKLTIRLHCLTSPIYWGYKTKVIGNSSENLLFRPRDKGVSIAEMKKKTIRVPLSDLADSMCVFVTNNIAVSRVAWLQHQWR